MQRALAAALICKGKTILQNTCMSDDSRVAKNIIQNLGAVITDLSSNSIQIMSEGFPHDFFPPDKKIQIFCGESGLSARMFACIAALCTNEIILSGEDSLQKRPMDFFDINFPFLNIKIQSDNGKLPVHFQGPLIPRDIEIDCSAGSQYLTGLLMAFSAANAAGITISVNNLKSAGYIGLTTDVMKKFGMPLPGFTDYSSFYFSGDAAINLSQQRIYTIEGDWSGSAFLLVAGAIAGNISISGLDMQSQQPDKAIAEVLESCGATILYKDDSIEISKSSLKAFDFDATGCPDLFPPLAALAACCEGISSIRGVHRLVHKESNRAEAIRQELKKMGVDIHIENDDLIIKGGSHVHQAAVIDTHGDHRIAMMCAIVALAANGETKIHHAEVVGKSFPGFFKSLQSLGANISFE